MEQESKSLHLKMLPSLIIAFCLLILVESARILAVIPTPSISHQVPFRPITQELAKRGHEVVIITTDPAFPKGQTPENLTEIDVHDISYQIWRETFLRTSTGNKDNLFEQMKIILILQLKIFLKQMEADQIQRMIHSKNETFDLLFIEGCSRPALLFTHLYKVPTILISSFGSFFGNHDIVGSAIHPLFYPIFTNQRIYNLTLWEKISELYNFYVFDNMFRSAEKVENEAIRSVFGSDVPTLSELSKNVDMLFLNVHPIWDTNRPVPPSVVYMGGVHQNPEKDLPTDLESYLNLSKHGVIYVSFGTNTNPSQLPPHRIQAMVKAFSSLPYDILWKWDADELPGRTKNIRISKWLPQPDLLKHPKIKLFITQAGLQSTDEAIIAGVPLLGIPMHVDQWFNAEKYVQLKLGLKLDMESLTSGELKAAIETVINDDTYRKNVIKFRSLMHDQPQKPLDRVVWWTEHVLRHGAKHLRAPTAGISWAEYIELDVILVLLAALLAVLAAVGTVGYYVVRLTFSTGKIKQS